MAQYSVSHEAAVKLAMSAYLSERCKFCGKEYKTLDDLQDTVFAGYHKHGRLACQSCWNEHAPTAEKDG
jgi:hypothetical protein